MTSNVSDHGSLMENGCKVQMRSPDYEDKVTTHKSQAIHDYLLENNVSVYKELCKLKEIGWNSSKAQKHYEDQRQLASSARSFPEVQEMFFRVMLQTVEGLDTETDALTFTSSLAPTPALANQRRQLPIRILSPCIALAAFSEYILRKYPKATIDGLSLPKELGGYELLISKVYSQTKEQRNLNITLTDVTLHRIFLPSGASIPNSFPDLAQFNNNTPLPPYLSSQTPVLYDLAICDAQRVPSHPSADLRQWEQSRICFSQLILALTHLKPGGTIIFLLHKPEHWRSMSLIYKLSLFSKVKLYKPIFAHSTRSSFYVVAKDVQSNAEPAIEFIEHMKRCWFTMTFGGDGERGQDGDPAGDLDVEDVLGRFGGEYAKLSLSVWERQRDGLRRAQKKDWALRSPRPVRGRGGSRISAQWTRQDTYDKGCLLA